MRSEKFLFIGIAWSSSNKDSEIEKAVEHGVNKINISSDIKVAYYNKMRSIEG